MLAEFAERPPRSVLIVMLTALGDAVHVLPVVNALKRAWPNTQITWVVQPVPHMLVKEHEAVDEFIVFERRRGTMSYKAYRDVWRRLHGRRFDLVLNLQVYLKAGLITALAPADVKLGYDRRRARELTSLFSTHRIPSRPVQHIQDEYFEFLEYLGISPEPVEWRLQLTRSQLDEQREFFAPLGRTCAIVVGSSKPEKNWQPANYARVIDALEVDFGLRCVLVGGPAPEERAAAIEITRLSRIKPLNSLGDSIRRLLYVLEGSTLVISGDTGPLHIARALDTPVIGLFGYTNPRRFGPYRKYTDLIVDGYARFPGEEYVASTERRPEGMSRVTVAAVLEKVQLALNRYPAKPAKS